MLNNSRYNILFETYGCYSGDGFTYIKTHFQRYLETLELLKNHALIRILELGASHPFAFTIMLKNTFPEGEVHLAQYRENHEHNVDYSAPDIINLKSLNYPSTQALHFEMKKFNVEKYMWPYENDFFDAVLCMELIEHLLLDPCFVFREANRVLKKGGIFIVTTPNIASYESVENLIQCKSPYTYGAYSSNGEYGRHNREFVPQEVKKLGESSGFDSILLTTRDVYDHKADISSKVKSFLDSMNVEQHLRGQTIFYKGIKTGKTATKYPDELFDYQPDYHCAEIDVLNLDNIVPAGSKIHVELKITNHGQYVWKNKTNDLTRLGILLLDTNNNLIERDFRRIDLPSEVSPGESIKIFSDIDGINTKGIFIFRFDMVHEFVCWFSNTQPKFRFIDKIIEII